FVSPPIGEGSDAGALSGHSVGHLVHLERMMEGTNFVSKLFGNRQLGQEFVGTIAVNLDQQFSAQDVSQLLKLQVLLWRTRLFVAALDFGVVLVPIADVLL